MHGSENSGNKYCSRNTGAHKNRTKGKIILFIITQVRGTAPGLTPGKTRLKESKGRKKERRNLSGAEESLSFIYLM
jgi:hypothetical protein